MCKVLRRRCVVLVALCASLVCVVGPGAAVASAAPAQPQITAAPSLFPTFDSRVRDYVTRCAGDSVRVSVAASAGTRVAVDGGEPRTGRFTALVRLRVGQRFSLAVLSRGRRRKTYHVRCLPSDFPAWTARRSGPTQAKFYVATPSFTTSFRPPPPGTSRDYVAIFDHNGVPVWWMRSPTPPMNSPIDAELLPDGTLAWTHYPIAGRYEIRKLDGSLVRTVKTVGTPLDHHEIQLLRNGNYLVGSYKRRSGVDLRSCGGSSDDTVEDAEIQEVTRAGKLVWSWNSKDHIDLSETTWCPTDDIVHFNSIEVDGQALVISMRHLDAVYKISRTTGRVLWKLGGTRRPESLRIVGDPTFGAFGLGGQHDARIRRDGTLTLHDNGAENSFVPNPEHRPPRAIRYRVDDQSRTATLIEEVRDPRVRAALCCGSARKLARGNWVMSWGTNSLITEMTPSGAPIFSLSFDANLFSYRADPVAFGTLRSRDLRRGMDAQYQPKLGASRRAR